MAFLTARWHWLAMANWTIDPAVLAPYVPRGTTLDTWNGRTYVSLVAFRFLDTRVKGIAIPFHRNFEEINLRFYVGREGEEGWRRGVVFIKEIVPKAAIAWVARVAYNENYVALPTQSRIDLDSDPREVAYGWRHCGRWDALAAAPVGAPAPLVPGSEEEFIAEHYWGYARQRDGSTKEYRVDHPPWRVWQTASVRIDVDFAALYAPAFADLAQRPPASTFVAEGSEVSVFPGATL